MKVIWKRPDGFHSAAPSDYEVVPVANSAKIWLHKHDNQNFPFRISGGWQDEAATKKLNQLVNLLNKEDSLWLDHLSESYFHSKAENPGVFVESLHSWLQEITENLKGDHWEVTIMGEVIAEVANKIEQLRQSFLGYAQQAQRSAQP